ncbi:MAG: copper chaperone PCu(A)C [Proteobacteria bacterium]|nr:copper chaperone PCu(A)C [Pseudomonadota bacterium]
MKSHSMIAMLALAFMATGIRNVPAAAPAQLRIEAPWARETAEGQRDGGGFMTIVNDGKSADQLVAASSPVSAEVQIHTVQLENGMMRMRELPEGIAIPAQGRVELKPRSLHIMFIKLQRPLRAGEKVPVTLKFRAGGEQTVMMEVRAMAASMMSPMPAPPAK